MPSDTFGRAITFDKVGDPLLVSLVGIFDLHIQSTARVDVDNGIAVHDQL
jgi:hypothetical protein